MFGMVVFIYWFGVGGLINLVALKELFVTFLSIDQCCWNNVCDFSGELLHHVLCAADL